MAVDVGTAEVRRKAGVSKPAETKINPQERKKLQPAGLRLPYGWISQPAAADKHREELPNANY